MTAGAVPTVGRVAVGLRAPFWALRGGGGGFAIVTALELDLLPIAEVYAGALVFPDELGAEAVRAYRDWTQTLPDEVSSIGRFLRPPPLPDVPEPLRDRPLWTVTAACIGSREAGGHLVAPLRELGEPIMDSFDQIPAAALSRINMDPEPPIPALGHHRLLRELSGEAIDALVGVVGPEARSPLLLTELCHAGGMLGRLHDALEPWSAAGGYLNFGERPCDVDALLPPQTCERLAEGKRRWDPDGLILANHAVSLTPA